MRSDATTTETVFEDVQRGLRATNPSFDDRALIDLLERHGVDEGAALARYERLAESETSAAIRYLMRLILDDERRHHRIIEEIANAIAWDGFAGPDVRTVPDLTPEQRRPDLLTATRELLAIERKDAKELRQLRRKLKPYADGTMWSLLIEMMLLDTGKHRRILEFIARHLTAAE